MGRLFWKTLLGFLLTYIAASFGVLPAYSLLRHPRLLTDEETATRVGPAAVDICRQMVIHSGPSACGRQISRLIIPRDAARIAVTAMDQSTPKGVVGTPPNLSATATAPDGRSYRIAYQLAPAGEWPLPVPLEVFLLGCVGSFAFSAVLVGYVVAPIRTIRGGFQELAKGNLTARVAQKVGQRRDEIADLARDFDVMAAQLEQLVSARDRLLHDVSHELRSPLSRLQLSIALARQNQEKLPSSLDRIESEGHRLSNIVNELLTLSRVESEIMRSSEYFDVQGLVSSVVDDVRFEAAGKNVTVAIEIYSDSDCESLFMRGSSELIRRAVENVLRNAVKFSQPGQQVCSRIGISDGCFVIEVSDEGPGVADALLPKIFEPFVTSDVKHAGMGLGLSIAQRAVRAHGGEISAKNRPIEGLMVTITLPGLQPSAVQDAN